MTSLTRPSEILQPPEVTLHWGNGGRDEFMSVLAESFTAYSEPPDWFFHTTWFWPHWWTHRRNGFDDMVEEISIVTDPAIVFEKGDKRIKEHVVTLDTERHPARRLVDIHSGTVHSPETQNDQAATFRLPGGGAFHIED